MAKKKKDKKSKKTKKAIKINPNNFCLDEVIAYAREHKLCKVELKDKDSKKKTDTKDKTEFLKKNQEDREVEALAKKVMSYKSRMKVVKVKEPIVI